MTSRFQDLRIIYGPEDDVPEHLRVKAVLGDCKLDLRQAEVPAEVTIDVKVRLGDVPIYVPALRERGEDIGETRFVGLFTSETYTREEDEVQLIRSKIKNMKATAPKSTQPAIVPRSVHPPKITAISAMNPRPPTIESSNCPTAASTR